MAKPEITHRKFIKGIAAAALSVTMLVVLQGCENSHKDSQPADTVSNGGGQSAVSDQTFTPGTYEASARGIDSDVKVTMSFDETRISDVKVDVSGETPDIGGKIGDQMADAILTAQSAEVDGVTGATVTSGAVKVAAADCISQASGS